MKSIFVPSELKHGSPEWVKARENSIGASSVGGIMGLSPYEPAAKIFYQKLGLLPSEQMENAPIFWGKALEGLIAESWSCHTGDENSYLKGEKQRPLIPVKGYYTTDAYPFITATPDTMSIGFQLKYGDDGSLERIKTDQPFPVEIKSISGYSVATWESGIPVYYLAQIMTQMLCTGSNYAELAMLVDGRDLRIYPIYKSEQLCELLIAKCVDFWDRITKARELMKDGVTEEVMSKIASLEPEPEGTPAYADFIKNKFKVDDTKKRIASQEEEQLMFSYLRALELEGQASDSKMDARNKLLRLSEDYGQLSTDKIIMVNKPASAERAKPYFSIKLLKQK